MTDRRVSESIRCVWSGRVSEAGRLVHEDAFYAACEKRYRREGLGTPGDAEKRSWRRSWPPMVEALLRAGLGGLWLYLEFITPGETSRFDAMLVGSNDETTLSVTVVELKQWTRAEIASRRRVGVRGVAEWQVHPVDQVNGYVAFLDHWYRHDSLKLQTSGVALLHDATAAEVDAIRRRTSPGEIELDRALLGRADIAPGVPAATLAASFGCADATPPSDQQIAEFERARWAPDSRLLDQIAAEFGEVGKGAGAAVIDGQQRVLAEVLDLAEMALKGEAQRRIVVMVTGGPGSGKTLVAMKLLGRLYRRGVAARYVTPSGALRKQFQAAATRSDPDGRSARAKKEFFPGFGTALQNVPLVLLDEGQRLSEENRFRTLLSRQFKRVPVVVVFFDERQVIRPREGVTEKEIREAARAEGADIHAFSLDGGFRCGGSRAYVEWVDDLLYGTPAPWTAGGYDVAPVANPRELEEWAAAHTTAGRSARISAGYCWPWDRNNRELKREVRITWADAAGNMNGHTPGMRTGFSGTSTVRSSPPRRPCGRPIPVETGRSAASTRPKDWSTTRPASSSAPTSSVAATTGWPVPTPATTRSSERPVRTTIWNALGTSTGCC
jgi:hypothetical protein